MDAFQKRYEVVKKLFLDSLDLANPSPTFRELMIMVFENVYDSGRFDALCEQYEKEKQRVA